MLKYIYENTSNISENPNEIYLYNKQELYKFFDKVYLTTKIILKEEKEVIFFFNNLTDLHKKIFDIKEYFDCIDIAYNYYNLMNEIQNSLIDEKTVRKNIEKWQEKYIDAIFEIDTNMKKSSKYAPNYLKYNECKVLDKFKNINIHLVDIMYLSKYELKLLQNISSSIYYHLGVEKGDFDEKNTILKNITYKKNNNVSAYSFKDMNSFIIYLTQYLNDNISRSENISIVDLSNDKSKYKQINENMLNYKNDNKFKNSKTYTVLKLFYEILVGRGLIAPLYYATLNKDFKTIFSIDDDICENIKKELISSKKYVKDDIFKLISDVELEDVYNKIISTFKTEASTFVEALTEIQSINEFEGFNVVNKKSDNLKLVLKYIQDKDFKNRIENSKYNFSNINKLDNIDELLLLNVNESLIKNDSNFILSIQDKKKLGIFTNLDMKYYTYYPYIKKINEAKKVKIFFIQNIEEDIDVSSIFKQYLYENNVVVEKIDYTPNNKVDFYNYIYKVKTIENCNNFLNSYDNVKVEKGYFDNISINGYNFCEFMESPIDLYFSKLLKDNKIDKIIIDNKTIGANVIGNIVHKIFQYAIDRHEYIKLDKIKDEVLSEYHEYIVKEYINVYDKLIFKDVLSKIEKFLKDNYNKTLISETKYVGNYRNLSVNFRQDIVVQNDDNSIEIVDIKTGKRKDPKNISKEYIYQLRLYRLFNEMQDRKVSNTYFYYPFDSNSYDKYNYGNITIEQLDAKIDEILNLKNINIENKNTINYNLKNILRGSDYEL